MSEIGPGPEGQANGGGDRETNMWAMFIHFSILCGWAVPLAGLILLVIWSLLLRPSGWACGLLNACRARSDA